MTSIQKKLLRGISEFRVADCFTELFLNELRTSGICPENIITDKTSTTFTVKYSESNKVREIIDKLQMEIISVKHTGMPYWFFKYRKRFGIPIGLLLSFCIISLLSSCLWNIDIEGNNCLSDEILLNELKLNSVSEGVFTSTVNCKDIEYFMYNRFDEISWISAQIVGSRLYIKIKERDNIYEIKDDSQYCNIVASKNGEVLRADIFEGRGSLTPGTPVVKGDLLVSGVIEFRSGGVRFVNASADIWAVTKNHITTGTAFRINAYEVSDAEENFGVTFFGCSFPFGSEEIINNENDKSYTHRYLFETGAIVFPVGIMRKISVKLNSATIELNAIQAILIAFNDYAEEVLQLDKKGEICDKTENIITGDSIYIEAEIGCVENIAEKKYFTVGEYSE